MCASRAVAIDVGAAHVTCAGFVRNLRGRLVLEQMDREAMDPAPATEAQWCENVARALGMIARRSRFKGEASLALPGHLAMVKRVTTPRVATAKRAPVIEFEASQAIPYPLDEVIWDHVVTTDRDAELELMLMAVKAEPMRALCDAVRSAGFALAGAIPSAVALARSFRFSHPEASAGAILVNVGARSTQVLFLERGRMLARTLPLAGNALTRALAEELHVDFGRAEAVKLQQLGVGEEQGRAQEIRTPAWLAAERFTASLRTEITRSIASARQHGFDPTPGALYLTGGGARFDALPGWLQETLAIPVHRFDPLWRDCVAVTCPKARVTSEDIADTLGLVSGLGDTARSGNLLPMSVREAAAFRQRQPVILAIAALVTLALLPPLWSYHRSATLTHRENAATVGKMASLRAIEQRSATDLARWEETRRQIASLQALAASRSNWTGFFAEVQKGLVEVEDTWLDRLVIERPPARSTDGNPAIAGQAPDLRLRLSGRMLDRENPEARVGAACHERVQRLLTNLGRSRFARVIEREQFDVSEPGILRFEFSMVVNSPNLR